MRPSFIIIGAMKSGTTSLSNYLAQTKDIFIPEEKDVYFFSDDGLYQKGMEWYESHFECEGKKIAGEGTDDYSKFWSNNKTAQRIKKDLSGAKLIYIVRHPLKQIESAWLHRRAASHEKLQFNEAILNSEFNYIETADYLDQLDVYNKLFDGKDILVLFNEDLKSDPESLLKECLRFLECDEDISMVDFTPQNTALGKRYDNKVASFLRRFKSITKFAQRLSPKLKNIAKAVFTEKLKSKPEWDYDVQQFVIDRLKDNSEKFLVKYGKPKDFWKFD